MELPQPFSNTEAKEKILLILSDGFVKPTFHCRKDSMVKRNIEIDDILEALQNGEIRHNPEWDEEHQNWKYKVCGRDVEEDELTVITVILEANLTLLIVTVW